MNIKSILFVIALCVGMQSWLVIGMEKEQQQSANQTSWWDYVPDVSGAIKRSASRTIEAAANVATAAKKRASQAATAVKKAPGTLWGTMKKGSENYPMTKAAGLAAFGATAVAGHELLGSGGISQVEYLAPRFRFGELIDLIAGRYSALRSHVSKDLVFIMPITGAVLFGVYALVEQVILSYRRQDIAKEEAVNRLKDIISLQLTNGLMYPTRSSTLHALLKKNEFLVDMKDVDGIVADACSALSREIAAIKPDQGVAAQYGMIDAEMSKIRTFFRNKNITTLEDQIRELSQDSDVAQALALLENSSVKAKISILLRLQQQQLVEAQTAGTFEQTSSARFYEPIPEEEAQAINRRKAMSSQKWEKKKQAIEALKKKEKRSKEAFATPPAVMSEEDRMEKEKEERRLKQEEEERLFNERELWEKEDIARANERGREQEEKNRKIIEDAAKIREEREKKEKEQKENG